MLKYYMVDMNCHLEKLKLAFNMKCEMEIKWKRGQKMAQSGCINFADGYCNFDKSINIQCSVVYQVETQKFIQKKTKLLILMHTERGTKQAGQIILDIATYLNQKQTGPKHYQMTLGKCPDKNALLSFTLEGAICQEASIESMSHNSAIPEKINLIQSKQSFMSPRKESSQLITRYKSKQKDSTDRQNRLINSQQITLHENDNTQIKSEIIKSNKQMMPPISDKKNKKSKSNSKNGKNPQGQRTIEQLKQLNKQMRQKLTMKQSIIEQNQKIKKKIKNQEFGSAKEYKEKIYNGRKEIDRLKERIRNQSRVQKQLRDIEEEVFRCKLQIMNAFNYASEFCERECVIDLQDICQVKEKYE